MVKDTEEQKHQDNEEISEDELEELLERQLKKKIDDPKHRGYGDYERRRIYRGPSVKRDPE
ncbi:hypothetical protein [Methanolobus sp. WCC4]|uniref:hypothetical protein n=1 Tax=Methanolobus sp. WCC4 TaxID=3125784 RepID=UPI0030F65E5C